MINGVATAVVSEVKDPENLGRVQIDLSAHGGAKEWARVVSPLTGRNVTIQFAIGDEVLVAFENDDARRPLVIGNVWDGTDSPPAKNQEPDAIFIPKKKTPVRHDK
jgi:uncharacterized protein involved in type VI secretion and phage assembly